MKPVKFENLAVGTVVTLRREGTFMDVKYISGPDYTNDVCVEYTNKAGNTMLFLEDACDLSEKSWGEVEGKLVYTGDTLYWNDSTQDPGTKFIVIGGTGGIADMVSGIIGKSIFEDGKVYDFPMSGVTCDCLTWTKPSKATTGWINIYPDTTLIGHKINAPFRVLEYPYLTEELANEAAGPGRIACVKVEFKS